MPVVLILFVDDEEAAGVVGIIPPNFLLPVIFCESFSDSEEDETNEIISLLGIF